MIFHGREIDFVLIEHDLNSKWKQYEQHDQRNLGEKHHNISKN